MPLMHKALLPLLLTLLLVVAALAPAWAADEPAPELSLAEQQQRAQAGDPEAQYNLGVRYATGQDVEQDYTKALQWYERAAESEHPLAENNLGAMYELGQGVEPDPQKAIAWYTKAAEHGQPYAQNSLAIKLFKGEGVERDPVMAYVWMRLAAEQDYDVAVRNADLIYSTLSDDQRIEAQHRLAEIWERESQQVRQQMFSK